MEDLQGIRSRATVRHNQRDRHSKWSFEQLGSFLQYKSKVAGVPLNIVEPRDTSRKCPRCSYVDKRNRKTRNEFKCLQCGYKAMADYVAACNIAARAAVKQPMVAPLFSAVTSPHPLGVGA